MRFAGIYACPLSTGLVAAALSMPLSVAARADIAISIDKSTQQMSVAVDGQPRYTWPVSTGRPGYDTPNGNFKPNRMDADHFSQEWDNAPMPHTIFFDLHGHAIHGFSDVKHLGLAVSHGCVRLSPEHAATLFDLVKTEGMANTHVSIGGRTPGGDNGPVARQRLPENQMVYSNAPVQIAPQYQPQPYGQQTYGQRAYGQQPDAQQPAPQYGEQQQPQYQDPPQYAQRQSQFPPQPPPYYGQRSYPQPYYGQQQPYYGQQYYAQPAYRQW
jgi:hypothetical protein